MTIAITIGRAIGSSAAHVAHGACVAASYSGQFGKDLASGTSAGYTDNALRLAAAREAARKARPASIAIKMTPALKSKLAKA